jgi:hypothetical protein
MDLNTLTYEKVEEQLKTETAEVPTSDILKRLESAKSAGKKAAAEVYLNQYALGRELSDNQMKAVRENFKEVVEAHPEEKVETIKFVIEETNGKREVVAKPVIRYRNTHPIGQHYDPLAGITEIDALTKLANIPVAQKMELAALTEAAETDEKAYRKLIATQEALIRELNITGNMFVLRQQLNEHAIGKTETKLEKAQSRMRFNQSRICALQGIVKERADLEIQERLIKRAGTWCSPEGIEWVRGKL